ncbi:MAG: 3-isopropylmalate dehydratase large subunit [Clostridiales Family XIII bacterium]|jgi:3-isopropylmalate/(R)-2-methylmalate dehydratase large subunit|nr:3-isopropylmalate dehydratase large subunit [Clostridiales Family XIII bacterium]
MGMTMSEKIIAAHAGVNRVKPGDIVTCDVDWIGIHDMFFTVGGQGDFSKIKKLHDPDKTVVLLDHGVPSPTPADAEGACGARAFVKKHGVKNFFDVGNHGVIHQKLAEEGFAAPGRMIACGDSHTCAAGAFNCAAGGFGPADMIYVLCVGQNWYQVAPTVKYELYGALPDLVTAKDLFLHIAGVFGEATNRNVEFGGPGLSSLSVPSRQSVATMCAEINAEFAIFPHDDVLEAYLRARARGAYEPVAADADAAYEEVRRIDLSELAPYVSGPHSIPNNCAPVRASAGLPIQQAILGSCSNGRIEDLALAARLIKGKKVANGVRFLVTPASQAIYLEALRKGYLETLAEAGAVITNATCGACYGGHLGLIGAGERCVSTTTRNFKGRMGSADAEILLAGPATVVASAVCGRISDPRDCFERGAAQ